MKPNITASIDAQMIYERLTASTVGDIIPYSELSGIVSRDVQTKGRGHMETARRMALREKGMVFGSVKNVGLKRLADTEIVQSGQSYISRIRRTARRGMRVLVSVQDFASLPNDLKVRHNATVSMLGAVTQFSGNSSQKRVESAVQKAGEKLNYSKTLELFGGNQ
jgi:hypothetical protein